MTNLQAPTLMIPNHRAFLNDLSFQVTEHERGKEKKLENTEGISNRKSKLTLMYMYVFHRRYAKVNMVRKRRRVDRG
jgi:hypothetical protein